MATEETTESRFTLDLDGLERESTPEPFTVKFGGKVYTFRDPQEIDYRVLGHAVTSADVNDFFPTTLGEEDGAEFLRNTIYPYQLTAVVDGYMKHYGLGDQGNSDASSPR